MKQALFILVFFSLLVACTYGANNKDSIQYKTLLRDAEEYKKNRDWENLENTVKAAIKYNQNSEYLWRTLSWSQMHQGKTEESLKTARENVRRNPDKPYAYARLADSALLTHNYRIASQALSRARKTRPDRNSEVFRALQNVCRNLVSREFTVSWKFDLKKIQVAEGNIVVFPLPSGPNQETTELSVHNAQSYQVIEKYGLPWIKVVTDNNQKFELRTKIVIKPYSLADRISHRKGNEPYPDGFDKYLTACSMWGRKNVINPKSPVLQEIVAPLISKDDLETVGNLTDWMKRIRFQETSYNTVEDIVAQGYGHCDPRATLLTGLCRAAGVPARNMRVRHISEGKLQGHSMTEVYIRGVGWLPVEPGRVSSIGVFGLSRIRLFDYAYEGYDRRLFNIGNLNRDDIQYTVKDVIENSLQKYYLRDN